MKRILPLLLSLLALPACILAAQVNFKARTPGFESAPPRAQVTHVQEKPGFESTPPSAQQQQYHKPEGDPKGPEQEKSQGKDKDKDKDDTKATPKGAHSVALSCTPSTSAGVTGYNFYRGTTPGGEATNAINATPVASCAYTDNTVSATTNYYYTAKAFCGTCNPNLSGPSNEATAQTPSDPQPLPPTGLTVGTVTTQSVPLHWVPPQPQVNYKVIAYSIMRGTQPNLPGPATVYIVPGNLQSYTDVGCKGTCYYEIKSYTIANGKSYVYSAPSNIVKAVD